MEHSSSSALLHLSHRLFLCTYYDSVYIIFDIIKPEPQLKRGLCPFISCVVTWSSSVLKQPPVYPLKFAFYITWGLGHVRTNATPFDRRKPPDHLGTGSSLNQSRLLIGLRPQESLGGLVEPEPLPRHLIGIMPRFQLGTWLT